MSLDWSLKELYDSFESEAFLSDLKQLDKQIKSMIDWVKEAITTHDKAKEKLEDYIGLTKELYLTQEKLTAFISLTLSVESRNKVAIKYNAILDNKVNQL